MRSCLVALALLAAGCGPAPDGGFSTVRGGPEDDPTPPPSGGGTCDEEVRGSFLNVELESDPGQPWWTCDDLPADVAPECGCIDGYLGLPDALPDAARPITEAELEAELRGIDPMLDGSQPATTALVAGPLTPEELGDQLLAANGTCALLEGMDERLLRVTVSRDEQFTEYRKRTLNFEDPLIGSFGGILLTPPGDGPFPGVVAMHGYGDEPEVFLDEYHGDWFPAAGYAILTLGLRGMCVDEYEDLGARTLLLSGFSVLGVRGYEAALGRKFLEWLPEVDPDRIGLIGHSTGSISGNVTVRTVPGFAAYVTDASDHYYAYFSFPLFADVMSPRTWPYNELINDLTTSAVPILQVGYGYGTLNEDDPCQPNELPLIFDFFDEQL